MKPGWDMGEVRLPSSWKKIFGEHRNAAPNKEMMIAAGARKIERRA